MHPDPPHLLYSISLHILFKFYDNTLLFIRVTIIITNLCYKVIGYPYFAYLRDKVSLISGKLPLFPFYR